jgi:hypothetical protein
MEAMALGVTVLSAAYLCLSDTLLNIQRHSALVRSFQYEYVLINSIKFNLSSETNMFVNRVQNMH